MALLSFPARLKQLADAAPDRPAVTTRNGTLSRAQLEERADTLAIVVVSQLAGLLLLVVALPFLPASSPTRMDYVWGAVAGLTGGLLFTNLYLGMVAIEQLHREWWLGGLLFALFWFTSLYSATFVLRLVGLWHFRALRHRPSATPPLWAMPGASLGIGR